MADIKKDRIVVVYGAIIMPMHDVLRLPTGPAPGYVTFVPVEPVRPTTERPLIRRARVLHELFVGTVDELVAEYRRKVTDAFNFTTSSQKDGAPPYLDTEKQNVVLERNHLEARCSALYKASWADLRAAELADGLAPGASARQEASERDALARAVLLYATLVPRNAPRPLDPLGTPVGDEDIQRLIKALSTWLEDRTS